MSAWRKIITSGSHAELRRITSGPISTTDKSYTVTQNVILSGENFLPNLDENFTNSTSNFTGDAYRIGYHGIYGTNEPDISGFDGADILNMTDGEDFTVSTYFCNATPISELSAVRYMYITLPDAINVDQWRIKFGSSTSNPNTGPYTNIGVRIEYATNDPTGLVGDVSFNNQWQSYSTPNLSQTAGLVFSNTNQTPAKYWRIVHNFNNLISSPVGGQMIISEIKAISNAGISQDEVVTATTDVYALQVTGSAKITEGIQTGFVQIPADANNIINSLSATSLIPQGVYFTCGSPGQLFISASKITGPAVRDLSLGESASTMSLGYDPTPGEELIGDTSLVHVRHDLQVANTASIGYLNVETGVSFDGVVIEGSPSFKDSPSFPNGFSSNFINEITENITTNGYVLNTPPYIEQTGRTILQGVIESDEEGGFVFDYTLTNGSAGRTGQFMLTKIGTAGSAIYDFTDTSTKHIGEETSIPFFSASLASTNVVLPMIVNGAGYTLRGVMKKTVS